MLTVVSVALVACNGSDPFGLRATLTPQAGTSRNLGNVSKDKAYDAALAVLGQHYRIDSEKSDREQGKIVCMPKSITAKRDRVLGNTPARQLVRFQLAQDGKSQVAHLVVVLQRQASYAKTSNYQFSEERLGDNYTGNPGNETPADLDAALTAEQKEAWVDQRALHVEEAKLLQQIAERLKSN